MDHLWPVYSLNQDSDALIEELGWLDSKDGVQNLWARRHFDLISAWWDAYLH